MNRIDFARLKVDNSEIEKRNLAESNNFYHIPPSFDCCLVFLFLSNELRIYSQRIENIEI